VQIGRRNESNELVRYHDRGDIEAGALDGQRLEICWLRDRLDLLAIQLEGSGRVILEDGTPLRISFDSHNGYPYSSIERVLISRNLIPRSAISRQAIRDWMAAHPDEAAKVRAANRSYVFFRVTGLTNEDEPVGAQGVPLTPGRSIAVDRVHAFGTPIFIEAELPIEDSRATSPFRRLMIAEDTGSAIVGPARADLYWGAGDEAGRIANRIRHPARFVMLLPRELDVGAAGHEPPLPMPKPNIAALGVEKQARSEVETVGAGSAHDHMPAPPRKPTIVRPAAKQRNDRVNSANARRERDRPAETVAPAKIAALEQRERDGKGNSAKVRASAALRPKSVSSEPNTRERKLTAETVGTSSRGASAGGLHNPLRSPKSKTANVEARKQNGERKVDSVSISGERGGKRSASPAPTSKIARTEVKKPKGEGKAEAGNAGRIPAGGKQKPLLATKSKTPAIDTKKQDAKGKGRAASAAENKAAKSSGQTTKRRMMSLN
jgi:3D (Asp-Asp-Asp) domain-containing protein